MTYSMPTNAGSTGHGLSWKYVRVRQLFPDRRTALVVDQFGKGMEISYLLMGAKGLRPDPGEDWVIEHKFGRWVFAAILTGPDGVAVEQVDGLTDALGDLDDSVSTLATEVDTRLDKHEAPGKHLWRHHATAATTINLPAGGNLTLINPFAVNTAGIATFVGTAIKFNRAGRWAINLNVEGGIPVDGTLLAEFSFGTPSPVTADGGFLDATTYGSAIYGYCALNLGWTGWVTPAQAAVSFHANLFWAPITGSTALQVFWAMSMEYLGPF